MSSLINQATIRIRRDSASAWTSANPTPGQGEWCLETDTKKIKIGDGVTAWTSLNYTAIDDIDGELAAKITGSTDQIAKAWVNFNGTGTVAIRDSYNVSSITDLGPGSYTVNFTNNLNSTDYSLSGFVRGDATTLGFLTASSGDTKTVSSVTIAANRAGSGATKYDSSEIDVHIFGS